jgi:FdhE protein
VSAEPATVELDAGPWEARRARAHELRERHPFADELLTLYLALLAVQEEAWSAWRADPADPAALAPWAAARVLPTVVETTVAAGPATLGDAVRSRAAAGTAGEALAGWLAGADLDPVGRYLARASLTPALEALAEQAGAACDPQATEGVACPHCGGFPQVSCLAATGESLVSGGRSLLCARCGGGFSHSRSVCPACGERGESRLTTYAERRDHEAPPTFPHLRIAGCETCRRYLIEVDLERDPFAVPEVDELTALPLDLHAAEHGLSKLTPNLMGF